MMRRWLVWLEWLCLSAALLGGCGTALAGVMTRQSMEQAFPSPLIVGEKERDLPVWPIYRQDATSTPIVAYAFESLDFAPIPGFSGVPMNLLVLLDRNGGFMDVRVLSHHEPVFLEGLGEKPLLRFVEQYKNLSIQQNIKIGLGNSPGGKSGSANVYIDGVAKATASVRILNQSLIAASLKVARARLGYSNGKDPELVARIRSDVFAVRDWAALEREGLITRKAFTNAGVEAAFANTAAQGADSEGAAQPNAPFVELAFAHLNVPTVGRNLLPARTWDYLQQRLEPGDHALLVMSKGRYGIVADDFIRGTVPDRLLLTQQKLPLELRDLDLDTTLNVPPEWADAQWRVFRVIAPAGLDPAQPLDFELVVSRAKGQFMPEIVRKGLPFSAQLPESYFRRAEGESKTWALSWTSRWWELALLLAALGLLGWQLSKPRWLVASPRRLQRFRTGYLLFTLFFVGWYAQGQLSIVNITAALQAVLAGRGLAFMLYDPMTVLLWAWVAVTVVVWGRGTFCGWLCPFGALQDLLGSVTQKLGLRPRKLPGRWDARLKWLKYLVLGTILCSAVVSVGWTDKLVEVEPFKTSITLNFVREWPFVLWALAAVLSSTLVYKGYCRYVCPLGAAMAVLGHLRRLDWIARRIECGNPCQRCRSDCAYQAIERSGKVDYQECFQCMECVVIHDSKELCVPVYLASRPRPVIPVVAVGGAA